MRVNRSIIDSGTDARVIALKQVEALKELSKNPANKLILPAEGMASLGSIAALTDIIKNSPQNAPVQPPAQPLA
ncbi:hypothetical protein SDC9_186454 [bioreactor metagenome]|uniref:Uncharacterized protein n=2 Tax=root TaxID=1 RepID=A0A645HL28_9ZZZZ